MRCPNCGAFVEDGKTVCTMCGTTINYDEQNAQNPFNNIQGFGNRNNYGNMNTFNSNNVSSSNVMNQTFNGNPNANPSFSTGSDFSTGMPNGNQNVSKRREDYENKFNSNYKDVDYKTNIKKEDRDIFDFFSENKKIINLVLIVILFGILTFAAFKYYQYKSKPVEVKPVLQNLYFEVDSSLQQVSSNTGNVVFNKSGEKGSACSISIVYGSSTSGDHVKDFFQVKKAALEPERDNENKVVDELKIYTASDSSMSINNEKWYYLNIFYKEKTNGEPNVLKYRYLTSTYKGYYYDIELVNNSNEAACNASLDNFAKSLKFIDA